MKKQSNPWDEKFGKRLQNLQPEPAFDAWDRIEAELENKPKRMAWWWAAAAASLLALPTAFYVWQTTGDGVGNTTPVAHHSSQSEPLATIKSNQDKAQPIFENTEKKKTNADLSSSTGAIATKESQSKETPGAGGTQTQGSDAFALNSDATGISKSDNSFTDDRASKKGENKTNITGASSGTKQLPSNSLVQSSDKTKALYSAASPETVEESAMAASRKPGTSSDPLYISTETSSSISPFDNKGEGLHGTITSVAPDAFPLHYSVKAPQYIPSYTAKPQIAVVHDKKEEHERNENKKNMQAKLWVEAMPTWSYRRIEPTQSDGVVITSLEEQPALSSDRMGGQLAAGVAYPITKKLKWKSGAYYWYQQQRWSYSYHEGKATSYMASFDQSRTLNVTPQFDEQTQMVDMTLHNVGLSTGLSLQMPTKFAASAIETKVLAQYNAYQSISSLLSMGYFIEANLSDNTKLSVGPSLQLQLNNNQSTNPHFEEKPLSAGIQMGVVF